MSANGSNFAVGVLGVGPNNGFPGTSTVLTALPGVLNNGVLINEPAGTVVFGPNPISSTGNIPIAGSPTSTVVVQFNNGSTFNGGATSSTVPVMFDSGGVTGTIPSSVYTGSVVNGAVPVGTTISVYTADTHTLLYSYTTTATNTPTVTGTTMNTGYEPFAQGPVYVSYNPTGYGATTFDA